MKIALSINTISEESYVQYSALLIYLKNYEEVKKLIDIVDISKNDELTVNISTALSNFNDTNYANKILDNFSGSKVSSLIYGNKSVILYNLAHYK
ncbi:hypothetical protein DS830_02955 [Bombilactobacillus bombi]|uniref:hypothetical protein n=1 Tax=Bombilactobacillus bombi TaxID=1303590 RepID=UPI000E57F46B|nr:hypothetical protein [Bombilactobacillus bombi]AXX64485.1 hypothetical protein DS830_02955 [Bombilactobacillus bombi]